MGFAHLSLLGIGLALLAVPLLLLLIHRKRQVIPWAAYYIMQLAAAKKKKRVQVTEWMKLISKLLLVLAAALYLARPYMGLGGEGHTLLVIDNSLSMATTMGNSTRLDAARERAAQVIRETPGRLTLATFDGELTVLARGQSDAAALERLLPAITTGGGSGTGRQLLDAVLGMDELDGFGQVIVVGDFQRQHYADGAVVAELSDRLPDGTRATLIPVDERAQVANLALLDWRLAPEGLHAGRQNTIEVRVHNFGSTAATQVPVTLTLDGADTDRGFATVAAGESQWLPLACPLMDATVRQLVVSLPTDDYPIDDRLDIVLTPRARLNVLAVVEEKTVDERFRRDIFMRSALLAVGGELAWNYQAVTPVQALYEDLGNYDLVVLFGVPLRTADPLTPRLREHLEAGRGVISFADTQVPEFWSGFAVDHSAATNAEQSVDPARLAGTYLDFLQGEGMSASQIHLFRSYSLANTPQTEGRLYLVGQADPIIRSQNVGAGRLICVGFQPAPGYSDIYFNPNFVQFSQRMAWEAMGLRPDVAAIGAELADLPLPLLSPNHRYSWGRTDEAPRPVALIDDAESPRLDLQPPTSGGIYHILADDETILTLGYNPSRDDSDIEAAGARLAAAATSRVRVASAGGGSGGATRELAWLGLIVLLAALVFEHYAHLVHRT